MIAHALGNPFDLREVMRVAEKYDLRVIEDCCDAFGATFDGRNVGTFGDIGTLSFYPAHHITTGEGGAVFTRSPRRKRILESLRDWGRDCWCRPGADNTCGKRFARAFAELPTGYDHKYVYSHCGYNLKLTDLQAAVGVAQLDSAADFVATRRENFSIMTETLLPYREVFILAEATPRSDPSWFGYPVTLRDGVGFSRTELVRHLDAAGIATRPLFAGNVTRQPYMQGRSFRTIDDLVNSDKVMRDTFWLGLYPGLNHRHIGYVGEVIGNFLKRDGRGS